MRLKKYILISISLITLWSCKDDSNEYTRDLILPTDLTFTINEDTSQYGLVNVYATATNANFYTITFNDIDGNVNKEVRDGKASYEYTKSGTYQITVKAHSLLENYIEESKSITLRFGEPGNNGNYPTSGYTSPLTYPNYTLVWQDEFDGNSLNLTDWNFDIGRGSNGWGNNELQYYRQENATVANGILTITAKQDFFGGANYTSSRITTQNKRDFKYGRIDVRAGMPYGKGIWPAIWMLGSNFSTDGWPFCGEIDIMEMVGGNVSGAGNDVVVGTAHWADTIGQRAQFGNSRKMSEPLANNWHVYSIIWDNNKIEWYIDDIKFHTLDIRPSELSEFKNSFFLILNVAVGGDWPGNPDVTTVFPQKMFIDYIRVFQ